MELSATMFLIINTDKKSENLGIVFMFNTFC